MRKNSLIKQWIQPILIGLVVLAVAGGLLWLGYRLSWTGFQAAEIAANADDRIFHVRALPAQRTLWDWLDVLIVPASLLLLGFLFNRSQSRRSLKLAERQAEIERQINADRQQESVLQDYFDRMTDLVVSGHLGPEGEQTKLRELARVRTLSVLLRLNGRRKGLVLQFLRELDLILDEQPIISLEGANLDEAQVGTRHLPGTSFKDSHLRNLLLRDANLKGADLEGAHLEGSRLIRADLSSAVLRCARLHKVNLEQAVLTGADLRGADLTDANLKGVVLGGTVNLKDAVLDGIRLDDAQITGNVIWPEGFEPPTIST